MLTMYVYQLIPRFTKLCDCSDAAINKRAATAIAVNGSLEKKAFSSIFNRKALLFQPLIEVLNLFGVYSEEG